MRKRVRIVLILAGLLASGVALGQGFGFGMGIMDVRGHGASKGAPATFLLLNAGGKISLNGGGSTLCDAC